MNHDNAWMKNWNGNQWCFEGNKNYSKQKKENRGCGVVLVIFHQFTKADSQVIYQNYMIKSVQGQSLMVYDLVIKKGYLAIGSPWW